MFESLFGRDPTPTLTRGDLVLHAYTLSDYPAWRRVRLKSRAFLKPFEPSWSEADLGLGAFRQRVARARREAASGTEFAFLLTLRGDLVGGLTLSNIRRRAAQQANLGYWMSQDAAGKGLMSRAVGMVLPYAFETLDLNRVHAACLPHNAASRRVLEKNGFREEGYAEHYLEIDGRWQDHVLYGLTRYRFRQSAK